MGMVDVALFGVDGLPGEYAKASRLPPRGVRYRNVPDPASHAVHPLQSAVNCQCVLLDLVPALKSV